MQQNTINKQRPVFYYFFPFVFSVYIFFYYINKYFTYTLAVLFVVAFFLLFCLKKTTLHRCFTLPIFLGVSFVLLILFSCVYAAYPSTAIKTGLDTFAVLFPGLYYYFYSDKVNFNILFGMLIRFSLFFSTITIISILIPPLYTNVIVRLLPSKLQAAALYFYGPTVSAGITDQTAVNAWISVIGGSVAFSLYCTRRKIKYLFLIFIFFLSILFTAKRAHLLFSIASMLVVYLKLYKRNIKKLIALLAILCMGCILVYRLFPNVVASMEARFVVSDNTDISSNRFLLWGIAFSFFLQRPITGWGFGYYSQVMPMNVHNVYLQVLCELGMIGLVVFIVFIIAAFFSLVIKFKKTYTAAAEIEKLKLVFSLFIQLFFILYCLTGNPLNDLNIFGVYFFAVCIVQNTKVRKKKCLYLR